MLRTSIPPILIGSNNELNSISCILSICLRTASVEWRTRRAADRKWGVQNLASQRGERRHLSAYMKYGDRLSQIISEPDFVGISDVELGVRLLNVGDLC